MMEKKELKILQEIFLKCTEFHPPLTPKQYNTYVKHIKEVMRKSK